MEKLKVNNNCLGCGLCVSKMEKYFEINDEGLSSVKQEEVEEEDKKELLNIIDECPVGAIVIEEEKE